MARASKSSADAQKIWEDRINRAKAVRKNWKDRFRVDLGYEYFEGAQNPGYPEEEWITVNKIYSHIKAQLPSLYASDPYFYVKLKRSYNPDPEMIAQYEQKGKIRQAYLNYLKDELNLKQEVRLCVQDAFFKYGVVKVHYRADRQKNPDFEQPILGEDGLPMTAEDGEILMEPEYIPINERYCIERVHPDDFLWDEDAGTTDKTWKWQAQRIIMTIDEARENPLFSRAAIKDIEGKGETKDEEQKKRDERKKGSDVVGRAEAIDPKSPDRKIDTVVTWEIYDWKNDTWTVIAEGAKTPLLLDSELPPGTEKSPFGVLRFTLRDDSPYPIPPVSMGIDVQKEFNLSRSRILTHRKRFNRKYQAAGQWDEDQLAKLETGDDGTVIKSDVPGSTIAPIADAPLDQWNYHEVNLLNNDMIELLGGSSDESRGIAGADSATQASILDKRLDMKEGDAMSMVIDFVKGVARKLDQLVQAHITEDEAVRIAGPEGEFWKVVRSEDYEEINGEFEYDVNVGATIPRMPQTERASWMAFLQLVAGTPQLLLSKALLKEMASQHHIENQVLIDEVYNIGQMIMKGQLAQPGQPGSLPGITENKPETTMGGIQGGPQSLNLPLAGNAQE
jgi:hypothetical protein